MTDELVFKDLEAEKATLGALFIDPNNASEILDIVQDIDFYYEANCLVIGEIRECVAKSQDFDIEIIRQSLQKKGLLDRIGGYAYLISTINSCVSSLHGILYAESVHQFGIRRRLIDGFSKLANDVVKGKQLSDIQIEIDSLLQKITNNLTTTSRLAYSAKELVALDLGEISWLVEGLIMAGGLNVVAGMPGAGKSFLILLLSICLATGNISWGNCLMKKASVLYFFLDGSQRGIRRRLIKLCKGLLIEIPDDLEFDFSPLNLSRKIDLKMLIDKIKEKQSNVVIFDVFSRYIPGVDENNATAIGEVFTNLRDISNTMDISFILIHHLNKGFSTDYNYRFRGSIEILGSVDAGIVVSEEGAMAERKIVPAKIREEQKPDSLGFKIISNNNETVINFSKNEKTENPTISLRDQLFLQLINVLQSNKEKSFSKKEIISQTKFQSIGSRTIDRVFIALANCENIIISKQGAYNYYQWSEDPPTTPLL